MGCAQIAAVAAEWITLPIDTAKVRLQLQDKAVEGEVQKYKGFVGTMKTIAGEEGVGSLWKGLVPGTHRQMINAPLRIGLYEPIRNIICGELKPGETPPLMKKILAGLLSGAIGITIANPTDVVKIRMQGQKTGAEAKYSSAMDCYAKTYKFEGIPGFWTGYGPNLMRNSIISCTEVATYDQFKQMLMQYTPMKDNLLTHFTAGLMAGFAATCVGSPFDVIKTRIMSRGSEFNGTIDCVVKTFRNDGILAFYKGFTSNFARIGSWNILMFIMFEQLKGHFNVNALKQ